MRVSTVSHKYK